MVVFNIQHKLLFSKLFIYACFCKPVQNNLPNKVKGMFDGKIRDVSALLEDTCKYKVAPVSKPAKIRQQKKSLFS